MKRIGMGAQSAPIYLNPQKPLEERVQDALSKMTTHEKVMLLHAQSKFTSAGVPRLGIRQLNMDDGPHGVREELEWNSWNPARYTNDSIVAFPSLTCLASTWNRLLSARYGNAVSEEFAFRGKDIMLGPGVNIARTPLCGRNFEYMGEDPYLSGAMVTPYIQSAQKNGVACCLKHFALNNQEIDRFKVNVNVSERALNEIYLPAFKNAVVDGGVWTVMGSYPLWNHIHMCHNDKLLNGILKGEWKFDGALISDWGGTTDTWQAATGGLDIEMGTFTDGKTKEAEFGYNDYYLADPFEKLINEGKIPMSVLNDKAARVLRTIFRTSMNTNKVIGSQCSDAHYDVCREIGEEGIILLKNAQSILPLQPKKYKRILIVGENATRILTLGGGSSELKTLRDISPLESLCHFFGNGIEYAKGYESGKVLYDKVDSIDPNLQKTLHDEAVTKAKVADLVIFIGGNAYATPWIDKVKGLIHCWYLGSTAGESLTNVLSGKVNPSGKLPVTFGKDLDDYGFAHYGKEAYPGVDGQVDYKEDIYVGYRWFDTKHITPRFPFGFGLSYTTFKYGKATLSADKISSNGHISLRIPITNTGKCFGKEIVQLYISDEQCSVNRPAKELKGFEKVSLNPGETKTVTFNITPEQLQYYNSDKHSWVSEPGKFKVYVCVSSSDIRSSVDFELLP